MKRVLLLSGYDAQSHRYWRHHLVSQFPEHQWTVLALADRHFSWRMGANALSFLAQHEHELNQDYDLLIATSMTDLNGLFGLFPHLAILPSTLYFHENQMAYPANKAQPDVIHYQLNSIKSALSAMQLIFNSNYNKNTFLTGVNKIARMAPESLPKNIKATLELKSHVLPVPLSSDCFTSKTTQHKTKNKTKECNKHLTVTWNHRWEHDKGPNTLLKLLSYCKTQLPSIKFNIIGQQFRNEPKEFNLIKNLHSSQIAHWGYIPQRTDYLKVLENSDIVLSTAHHEFQGLAIMEAVASGCIPLLPNRLAYSEYYPKTYLYPSSPNHAETEALAVAKILSNWQFKLPQTPQISQLAWCQLRPQYQNILINN